MAIFLLAVLQTWTRDLRFHPHVHCVVPGGGLSTDRLRWVRPQCPDYFLPQAALAMRFRTRLKRMLQQDHPRLFVQIPRQVWKLNWVADVQPVGSGEPALKYLAAYVYRTALSAEKIVADDGQRITFSYRDNQRRLRKLSLCPQAFLHRFLQHVLPRGLQRVRYFGWLSPAATVRWERIRALLDCQSPSTPDPRPSTVPMCPCCHKPMRLLGLLPRAPPNPRVLARLPATRLLSAGVNAWALSRLRQNVPGRLTLGCEPIPWTGKLRWRALPGVCQPEGRSKKARSDDQPAGELAKRKRQGRG